MHANSTCSEPLMCRVLVLSLRTSSSAEAAAKHVVTIAKAFADDVNACKALRELSKVRENDAAKALHKVLKKFDLTLDIPLSYLELGTDCKIPCLMPADYIMALQRKGYLYRLVGGPLSSSPWDSIKDLHLTNFMVMKCYEC